MIFRLDFFICERCESISSDSDAKNDDHKWWHSLLVLRKSLIEPVLGVETAPNKVETTGMRAEAQSAAADSDLLRTDDSDPDTNPPSALTRISAVEDKFHVALTAMEDKSDSTRLALEGQLSSIEEKVVKLDDIEKMVVKLDDIEQTMAKLGDIEDRMVKLDGIEQTMAKLGEIEDRMVKLEDIEERMAKLDVIDERMDKLDVIEGKVVNLDDKIADLKDMLEELMGRL